MSQCTVYESDCHAEGYNGDCNMFGAIMLGSPSISRSVEERHFVSLPSLSALIALLLFIIPTMTLAEEDYCNAGDSALFQAIKTKKWDRVKELLHSQPDLTKEADEYGNLPLHSAIGFQSPDELLLELLEIHPEACQVHGTDFWLPLHIAAMWGVSAPVLHALISAYPQALDDKGDPGIKGRTPRHFASRFPHNTEALERPTEEWIAISQQDRQQAQMERKRAFDRVKHQPQPS